MAKKQSRKAWLAHDVIPAGKAEPCSEEVQMIREESQRGLDELRWQYIQKRSKHQREAANQGESAFEKYFHGHKAVKKAENFHRLRALIVHTRICIIKKRDDVLSQIATDCILVYR